MIYAKDKPYRDRKLLDLAHKVERCQFQLPGVCIAFSEEGCEPAHSNMQKDGKGIGLKASDERHVAACHACHAEYDNGHIFSKAQKDEYFERGWARTMSLYFKMGWLKVV